MLWIVATQSGGDWFHGRPSIDVRGDTFQLVRGSGHAAQSSFIIDPASDGITAISTGVRPFPAEKYPRVELVVRSAQLPPEVSFAWRTREQGNRSFSLPLQQLTEGFAPLHLAASDDWRGTIIGIGLIVRGKVVAPIEIAYVRLPSASALATAREALAEWTAFVPLKGYSIVFPFDAERGTYMPMAKAVAIATGVAIVAYVLIARRRGRAPSMRVSYGRIFAGGWLLLDARWQVNVLHQVGITAQRFAGKTSEEKLLAGEGSELVMLVDEIRRLLPPAPARVLFLCDNDVIGLRAAYLLYPYNVFHDVKTGPAKVNVFREAKGGLSKAHGTAPDHEILRSGDYVVLFFYGDLGYDFDKQLLVWPDGHTRAAESMLSKPNMLLVRVR